MDLGITLRKRNKVIPEMKKMNIEAWFGRPVRNLAQIAALERPSYLVPS